MTTKHTHPMVFGRREQGCPRCAELNAGAPVIQRMWSRAKTLTYYEQAHNCIVAKCGSVCTYGDW